MTIEQKAQAYDKVRDKIVLRFGTNVAKEIFSQFEESVDERIRKWLIGYFNQYIIDGMPQVFGNGLNVKDVIAWLEKQPSNADNANKEYWRGYREGKQEILDKYAEFEKQGEQKSYASETMNEKGDFDDCFTRMMEKEQKPTDKVSLDFKKGDILYEQKTMSILLVYERNGSWLMTFCDYWMLKEKFHVEFPYESYGFVQEMSLVPATKEQRGLLFQKMKEAGYGWDSKKKELKKIVAPIFHIGDRVRYKEHACDGVITEITDTDYICGDAKLPISTQDKLELVEHNSSWSEEDEKNYDISLKIMCASNKSEELINKLYDWFKSLKDRVQPKQEWSEEDENIRLRLIDYLYGKSRLTKDREDGISWLKSLRPQINITDEELAQAKKDAYNDVLDKIEYDGENPTFDDGWHAAIWYLKKRIIQAKNK